MIRQYKKVILLGSAALKIGEAGEFDYSGSQAIKALKNEGIYTILINPNIATIQTSEQLADKVYLIPVTPEMVEKVIEQEKPDGILLSFGGQTALNTGLALYKSGVFEKYSVEVLGTSVDIIETTEDRQIFAETLRAINVHTPVSQSAANIEEAINIANRISYPVMVRIAYALGGLGSGRCADEEELVQLAEKAFSYTDQILIEEYLQGWKEIEYEVVRDKFDNAVTVCNMENFDPLGVHTGESIVIAPSQTLNNHEYHMLREIAIKTVKHLGIVGECNIQYALDPYSDKYRVIEVNARLSRSSALASKATGYPLAYIAAKLTLGYNVMELMNSITHSTTAFFEPALDYVVVKIPRWDLKKFRQVSHRLGSSMKSVGEVMAIGKTFQESIQKALRMIDIGAVGLVGNDILGNKPVEELRSILQYPTDERIFCIPYAFKAGLSIDEIHQLSAIDRWFLYRLKDIYDYADKLDTYKGGVCPRDMLLVAKKKGFSDVQVAQLLGMTERQVRLSRINHGIRARIKQIDTLAGEYPAVTNYLYTTYHSDVDDITPKNKKGVVVLGSGPYRIGSSVEFDWCCVSAVNTVKENGYDSILINNNPETVSTDYDVVDRLYFEELSLERVLDIYMFENPYGVILSMGGQISNNLAMPLKDYGVTILGTSPDNVDQAENRHRFSAMLDQLEINQPEWRELTTIDDAYEFAKQTGYPLLVRPSYVLSGAAMGVATNNEELNDLLSQAKTISKDFPVVISKFILKAKEIEVDAVANKGNVIAHAISEHVENAGVHSGDATLVFPPQRIYPETMRAIRKIMQKIAKGLAITGPFNIQFIAKGGTLRVIECNLRASRSFPFISKIYRSNFIELATKAILGLEVEPLKKDYQSIDYVGVKTSQFSFTRLAGADPTLGVEMSSTGEVGCLGDSFNEALIKSLLSVGYKFPLKKILISSGTLEEKVNLIEAVENFNSLGIEFFATEGTANFMEKQRIKCHKVNWPDSDEQNNVLDLIASKTLDLVINIPKSFHKSELTNDYMIRRKAVDFSIPIITNAQLVKKLAEALTDKQCEIKLKSMGEYK